MQDQAKLALRYSRIRNPPQKECVDVQLHVRTRLHLPKKYESSNDIRTQIAILLANGLVYDALQYLRQRPGTASFSSNMLAYLYERASELGKLETVLQLNLTTSEDKELVSFLKRSERPGSLVRMI